jgi:tRNA (mo5U34)-methyltransferase
MAIHTVLRIFASTCGAATLRLSLFAKLTWASYDGIVVDEHAIPLCSQPTSDDWWHKFETLLSLHLPDLAGKTVLDVGVNGGYFSLAAERLGASRVVAVDTLACRRPQDEAVFQRTKNALASKVEKLELEVLDIGPETVGQFDVVLLLGVLNQVREPLRVLERIASVTKELLVLEAVVDMTLTPTPVAEFRPWEQSRQQTTWWGPNRAAVRGMLLSVGFEEVVFYPVARCSVMRLAGVPARVKGTIDAMASMPWGARRRLARKLARGALVQCHFVAHSRRRSVDAVAVAGAATAHTAGVTQRLRPGPALQGSSRREQVAS